MFSFNPFVLDYSRPKSSYVFDDLYSPFLSYGYMREQPNLFRSSSFRQPVYNSSFNEKFKPRLESENDLEDEFDPFRELFGLRKAKERKQQGSEDLKSSSESLKSQVESLKRLNEQTKSVNQEKYLDSARIDTNDSIEFRFINYRCNDPSGVNVKITKDNYIVLETKDGFVWKSRMPNDTGDISKASCTLVNGCLILRLPKKVSSQSEEDVKRNKIKNDPVKNNEIMNDLVENNETKNDLVKNNETKNDPVKNNEQVNKSSNSADQDKTDEEIDFDAPIIEDIPEYEMD